MISGLAGQVGLVSKHSAHRDRPDQADPAAEVFFGQSTHAYRQKK